MVLIIIGVILVLCAVDIVFYLKKISASLDVLVKKQTPSDTE